MRCYRLGEALGEMVQTLRPADERVVVLGLGGLSHWLCLPEQGKVAEAFDADFMARMVAGQSDELARITMQDLREASGNGGQELTAWLFMAGALNGARGETLFYESMPAWITGMGGLQLTPDGPRGRGLMPSSPDSPAAAGQSLVVIGAGLAGPARRRGRAGGGIRRAHPAGRRRTAPALRPPAAVQGGVAAGGGGARDRPGGGRFAGGPVHRAQARPPGGGHRPAGSGG